MKGNILMAAYTRYCTDARVVREAEAAVGAGWKVDFLALRESNEPPRETIRGVDIIRLHQERYRGSSRSRYFLSYFMFFFRLFFHGTWLHLKRKYKLIHVNNMPDFLVFAFLIPKLLGVKLILDIHDAMPLLYLNKFRDGGLRLMYKIILLQQRLSAKFADRVVTVHEPIKADVLVKDGIPAWKIEVIANFADESKFHPGANYVFDGKMRMLYHGTIAERFGFDYVMSELENVKDLDFLLTIIGEGDFAGSLNDLIRVHGLQEKVVFQNLTYPIEEVNEILCKHNLGLVTYSRSVVTDYMLPVKFFEYLAAGIPALSLRNKALSYYIKPEEAFFFEPGVRGSLSEMIRALVRTPELLNAMRNKVLEVRKRFRWQNEAQKYNELISKTIEA